MCWREQGVPVVFTNRDVLYGLDACHLSTQRVHRVCSSTALAELGEAEVGNRQSYVDCGVVTIRYAEIGRLCCVGGKSRVSVVLVRHTFCGSSAQLATIRSARREPAALSMSHRP